MTAPGCEFNTATVTSWSLFLFQPTLTARAWHTARASSCRVDKHYVLTPPFMDVTPSSFGTPCPPLSPSHWEHSRSPWEPMRQMEHWRWSFSHVDCTSSWGVSSSSSSREPSPGPAAVGWRLQLCKSRASAILPFPPGFFAVTLASKCT